MRKAEVNRVTITMALLKMNTRLHVLTMNHQQRATTTTGRRNAGCGSTDNRTIPIPARNRTPGPISTEYLRQFSRLRGQRCSSDGLVPQHQVAVVSDVSETPESYSATTTIQHFPLKRRNKVITPIRSSSPSTSTETGCPTRIVQAKDKMVTLCTT
jgi:hypothetical protein